MKSVKFVMQSRKATTKYRSQPWYVLLMDWSHNVISLKTDISNFGIPSYTSNSNPHNDNDENDEDKGYAAVAAKEEVIMIHASIETGSTNQHATPFIQKFITELYKGDNMIKIVPVNDKTFAPSDKLDRNKGLPDDESKLCKWFTNIKPVKTKLTFTMKITTINIRNVRSVVYAWCKGQGYWINFTSLAATQKFFGGWFIFLRTTVFFIVLHRASIRKCPRIAVLLGRCLVNLHF